MDNERRLNEILNGSRPTYILVRRDKSGALVPLELTLFPDISRVSLADQHIYLEFQMKYNIPLLEPIDWTDIKHKQIMAVELPEFNRVAIDQSLCDLNLKASENYVRNLNSLEMKLKLMTKYHVFARFKQMQNGKMIDKHELLYFGPSKVIAKKTCQYFEEKYSSENLIDFILSKCSKQRDFEFCGVAIVTA